MKKFFLATITLSCIFFSHLSSAELYTECDDNLVSYFNLNIYLNTVLSDYTDKDYYKLIGDNLSTDEVTEVATKISEILKKEVYKDNRTVFSSCVYKSDRLGAVTESVYKVVFMGLEYKLTTNYFSRNGYHDQLRVIIYKVDPS